MQGRPDEEESLRRSECVWEEVHRLWSGLWDGLALTETEARALKVAEEHLDCAPHARSLEHLLRSWSSFVMHVELGWDDCEAEFTNDLSTRDILERLIWAVPASVREKIVPLVEPWDVRWKAATLQVKEPQTGWLRRVGNQVVRVPNDEIAWWNFRVPKVIYPFEFDDWHYTVVDEK